jgi:hypothetical protein
MSPEKNYARKRTEKREEMKKKLGVTCYLVMAPEKKLLACR